MSEKQPIGGIHLNSEAVYQPSVRERIFRGDYGITRIEFRSEYMGDHSTAWFDCYKENDLAMSISEKAVAMVFYEPASPEEGDE